MLVKRALEEYEARKGLCIGVSRAVRRIKEERGMAERIVNKSDRCESYYCKARAHKVGFAGGRTRSDLSTGIKKGEWKPLPEGLDRNRLAKPQGMVQGEYFSPKHAPPF
jgi:hypothetical protein